MSLDGCFNALSSLFFNSSFIRNLMSKKTFFIVFVEILSHGFAKDLFSFNPKNLLQHSKKLFQFFLLPEKFYLTTETEGTIGLNQISHLLYSDPDCSIDPLYNASLNVNVSVLKVGVFEIDYVTNLSHQPPLFKTIKNLFSPNCEKWLVNVLFIS